MGDFIKEDIRISSNFRQNYNLLEGSTLSQEIKTFSNNFKKEKPSSKNLIVVIEDETMVLMGYKMLFESWDFDVVACASHHEAIEELKTFEKDPDVIVADYRLRKGETGLRAIQTIRENYGPHIPAILITGDTAVDRLRDAISSGLPIMHKPVNGQALQAMIANFLKQ